MSGFDYINPHADIPLFKAAAATLKELGSKAMSVAGAVADGVAAGVNGAIDGFASVTNVSLGSFMSAPERSTEVAISKERAPAIEAPAKPHEVSMAELGSFSAPSFGNASRGGNGIGIG